MLRWTIIFLFGAIVTAVFQFGNIPGSIGCGDNKKNTDLKDLKWCINFNFRKSLEH